MTVKKTGISLSGFAGLNSQTIATKALFGGVRAAPKKRRAKKKVVKKKAVRRAPAKRKVAKRKGPAKGSPAMKRKMAALRARRK